MLNYGSSSELAKVHYCSGIKGDGYAYIDTEFKPCPATTRLETVFTRTSNKDGIIGMLGARLPNIPSTYCSIFQTTWDVNQFRIDWGWSGSGGDPNCYNNINQPYSIICEGDEVWVGNNYFNQNGPRLSTYLDQSIYLFTINNGGLANLTCSDGIFGETKIFDNGILVRHLKPCYTDSGQVGMWCSITNKLYTSSRGVLKAII